MRERRPPRRDGRAVLLIGFAGPAAGLLLPRAHLGRLAEDPAAGAFVVNILAADQRELCRAFAVTGGDKFAGIPWRPAGNGAPLLDGVLASVECELADVLDGGDHAIALGRVTALTVHRDDAAPLLYFRRSYGRLSPGSRPSRPAASASMSSSMAAARSRSEA